MDTISPTRRSANMARITSRNTSPELKVRRILHAMGYRYRLHAKDLPGKPDIVFRSRRKVIFVHGCFWHLHTHCREGRLPGSNTGYWSLKLERNKQRDHKHRRSLVRDGWKVLVVWECQTGSSALSARLTRFLDNWH